MQDKRLQAPAFYHIFFRKCIRIAGGTSDVTPYLNLVFIVQIFVNQYLSRSRGHFSYYKAAINKQINQTCNK